MVTGVTLLGASVNDFIFAYLLHASVILMAQVIVLLVVVFAIFQVSCYHSDGVHIVNMSQIEMEGNIFLYGLIVWLTSMLCELPWLL